ncbi:hypothetical protein DAETH_02390 [Deinococcus aetherius]|uniref:Uncharacterized protein n=1 Tax=Deinococcus aetherius TaxID=200252 RepID=A0ABN6RA79_9DEIO|nr:hypothetical protein [Deinococcus aetherius]BDP40270.1 hypothetical protein DAETH_02390 [Deinococcus aetherius]
MTQEDLTGNVLHCPRCGRAYRFTRTAHGHAVRVREKRWPWSREATWQGWGEWTEPLGKFRCRCGSGLTLR